MRKTYLAVRSSAELRGVCADVSRLMNLPDFTFDAEDSWEYGVSKGQAFQLNVTKTTNFSTISTWMSKAPKGVNYQIIMTSDNSEHQSHVEHVEVGIESHAGSESHCLL